jgi:hypothetical protein
MLWAGITFAVCSGKVLLFVAFTGLFAQPLAVAWIPVIYATIHYGRRVGLACVGVVLGFGLLAPFHLEWVFEVVLAQLILVYLIGRLRDQAKASVVAAWTVIQARRHLELIDLILMEWGYTDADTRLKQIRNLRSTQANYQMVLEARLAGAEEGHEPRF